MKRLRLLLLRLTATAEGDAQLLGLLRGLDRDRYEPVVLSAAPGPVLDACRALGAETDLRSLCTCFSAGGDKLRIGMLLIRPGVILALVRYAKYLRSYVREHHIDIGCSLTEKGRLLYRLAGIPNFDPGGTGLVERSLKVALFTDSDLFAGTERHILDLARGLREAGIAVSIACPRHAPLAERAGANNIEHIAIEKRGFLDLFAIGTLRQRLRSGELNLIHAHNGRTALSAALAVKLARRGTFVLTQHFLAPCRTGRRGITAAASGIVHRWISRSAGHLIAISEAVRRGVEERGEARGNLTTVANGIAVPDVTQLPNPISVRESLGIGARQPLIVCAARLEPEKDVASLVEAMPAVLATLPDATCIIAGEGSQRDIIASRINALGIRKSVRLTGFREDVVSIINASDLFVLPSIAEPFGLVLIEAMSLSRAVIATCAGGPREIVDDGKTGLLVPPADPAGLAVAITRLLSDNPFRLAMGALGRQRFADQYTLPRMTSAIIAVYRAAMYPNRSWSERVFRNPAARPYRESGTACTTANAAH